MTTLKVPDLPVPSHLTGLVERVSRQGLPWVTVSSAAVARWQAKDPAAWTTVLQWLEAQGVTLVLI